MKSDEETQVPSRGNKKAKPLRENFMMALAIFVVMAALPFAVIDTFQTGRVYLFSRQFLEELPHRFTGPGNFRFILQPLVAILLGIRGGLADVKAGNPTYLFALLSTPGRRKEALRNGVSVIRNLLALGIILDILFQIVLYHEVHPGAALLVGPIFICGPYLFSRASTGALLRQFGKKDNHTCARI